MLSAARSPTGRDHIARIGCCSLSLDTRLWGAHTTALDSLAAAVGVVTVRGAHVGARTAHSLLLSVGMGPLSARSQRASADLIVALMLPRRGGGAGGLEALPDDVPRRGAHAQRRSAGGGVTRTARGPTAQSAVAIEVDLQ